MKRHRASRAQGANRLQDARVPPVDSSESAPAWLSGWRSPLLAAILLMFFVLSGVLAARTHTPTVDEFCYIPMGLHYWRTGRFEIDRRGPPLVKMLAALPLLAEEVELPQEPQWRGDGEGWWPWIFATRFMHLNAGHYFDFFFRGRLVMVLIGLLGGIFLWQWARRIYSPPVALGCLLFYCTCPTVLGHSSVATLDIGTSVFSLAGFYVLWRWSESRRPAFAALAGLSFGLAVAAKYSALFLFPLAPLLCALRWGDWRTPGSARRFAEGMLLAAFCGWLTIEAAYLFQGFPLPHAMIEGIRLKTGDASTGEFPSFLLGSWSNKGWRSYYPIAMGLKQTVPFLILLGVSLFDLLRNRQRWQQDAWLYLPPLMLLYMLSFHYTINYGIRYLLPGIPFLILLLGRGMSCLARQRAGRLVLGLLIAWQVVTSATATPHHVSYFNELAGGPERNRHQLLDSNLDWGQDLGALKAYLDAQHLGKIGLAYFGHVDPALYGIEYSFPPPQPAPGIFAISANYLAGYPYAVTYAGTGTDPLQVRPGAWTWLNRFRPIAIVGRSIFVYRIEPGDPGLPN